MTSLRTEFPMIGLVLVTHGRLADEFSAALEHVMGPQEQMEAITIGANDDPDLCRTAIIEAVEASDDSEGNIGKYARGTLERLPFHHRLLHGMQRSVGRG